MLIGSAEPQGTFAEVCTCQCHRHYGGEPPGCFKAPENAAPPAVKITYNIIYIYRMERATESELLYINCMKLFMPNYV